MHYHSGDDGDVLYALASMKRIGDVDFRLTPSTGVVRSPYTPSKAERLASLIRAQSYIRSCEYATKEQRDSDTEAVNIDGFRGRCAGETILQWQSDYLGLGWIPHDPWLTVPDPKKVAEVVIHRSERYANDNFPWWDVPGGFRGRCVMVGSEQEHRTFCDRFGEVPYYPTADFLQLAQVIAGANLFVGNQSAPMAVALGLGANVVQEVCPWTANCRLDRANAQYVWHWQDGIEWDRAEFSTAVALAGGRTLMTDDRLTRLARLVRETAGLGGHMAEAGVCRGGSAKVITTVDPKRTLHLFDTFAGLPEDDTEPDGHKRGEFPADLDEVKEYLSGNNVKLYPGRLPDTLAGLEPTTRFSFVHLDLDIYQSTKSALAYFWPRMLAGGVVVLDDYGWQNCPGVAKAVQEECPGVEVHLGESQAWLYRPATSHQRCGCSACEWALGN